MGVDDEFCGIGATAFSLMRSRMVLHDDDAELFKKTLAKAVEKGVLRGRLTAIIDSSPVHGAGRWRTPTSWSGVSCARWCGPRAIA